MLDLEDLYKQRVAVHFTDFTEVILDRKTLSDIETAAEVLAHFKLQSETAYKKDGASLKTRFKTGFKGEAAVEKLLGIKIMDLSTGVSINYDHPDIPGYSIGVKTVRDGSFPIIQKNNEYAQIICIVDPNIDARVYVCGLATKDILNKFQSDLLVRDSNILEKGTKTGFFGFHTLVKINDAKDIEAFKLTDDEAKHFAELRKENEDKYAKETKPKRTRKVKVEEPEDDIDEDDEDDDI